MKMILILVAICIWFSNQVWCQLPAKCIDQNYWQELIELSTVDSNENSRRFLSEEWFFIIEREVKEIDSEVGRTRILHQKSQTSSIDLPSFGISIKDTFIRRRTDSDILSNHPFYISLALFDNFAHVEHQGHYSVSIRHEEDSTFVIPAQPYRYGFTYQLNRDSFLMRLNKIDNDNLKKYGYCTRHNFIIEVNFINLDYYLIQVPYFHIFFPTSHIDFHDSDFFYYKRELLIIKLDRNLSYLRNIPFDYHSIFSRHNRRTHLQFSDNFIFYYSLISLDHWVTTSIVW